MKSFGKIVLGCVMLVLRKFFDFVLFSFQVVARQVPVFVQFSFF